MRSRSFVFATSSVALIGLVAALVNCLADPREDDVVVATGACELSRLSTDPKSLESTLRAYLEGTEMLVQQTTSAEVELRDACNEMNKELGFAAGTDAISACKSIAAYGEGIIKTGGPASAPFGPGAPEWAEFRFASNCSAPPNALESCLASCAPDGCDVSKCDPAQVIGKCDGECDGTCSTKGDETPCLGECLGEVAIKGPPTVCKGQCDGFCTGPTWAAKCNGACAGFFLGRCEGTCTGVCDNTPINVPPASDAGADAEADAAPPPPPPPGPPPLNPPPDNAPGNCKPNAEGAGGICTGVCSKGANGFCANAPCLDFPDAGPPGLSAYSGFCPDLCGGGTCRAANGTGSSAASTCKGECISTVKQCTGEGICRGKCNGTLTAKSCNGVYKCGQNAQCENACQAKALLSTTCAEPKVLEAYAVTDARLAQAWKNHGPRLGKVLSRLPYIRDAIGYSTSHAYGDFVGIGLRGDLVRTCALKGAENVRTAEAKFTSLLAANPSVRKQVVAQ